MPFKNLAQSKACFAKKRAGTNGSWNCDEFAKATDYSKLPEKKKVKKWKKTKKPV